MYLEHLIILIDRAGWKVTKLYAHYTFEQETFKKVFISMNQRSRQTAKSSVEKNLKIFLINSNFGYEYRNNLDNCTFILIFDELNEVTYHKIYYSLFDQEMSKYLSSDLMKQDTEEQHNDALQ